MTATVGASTLSLADRIREAIDQDKIQLPPLPELALRLRRLLADTDHADAAQIAALVENDPAVAASLLRFANAAAFRGLSPIGEVRQAIARLGLTRVSSVVTAMQLKDQFTNDAPERNRILHGLWDHSVASALFCRHLAERQGIDADEAFLAGLLHDVGKLLVLRGTDYLESEDASFRVTVRTLDELMVVMHQDLGHLTLTAWNLPETTCLTAHRHEEPVDEGDPILLTIVQASDLLARKLGMHPRPDLELNLLDEAAIDRLELRDIELAALLVDLEDQFQQVRDLF